MWLCMWLYFFLNLFKGFYQQISWGYLGKVHYVFDWEICYIIWICWTRGDRQCSLGIECGAWFYRERGVSPDTINVWSITAFRKERAIGWKAKSFLARIHGLQWDKKQEEIPVWSSVLIQAIQLTISRYMLRLLLISSQSKLTVDWRRLLSSFWNHLAMLRLRSAYVDLCIVWKWS